MECRKFNAYMPRVNEAWTAQVLGVSQNPTKGIDLIGANSDLEVKFTFIDPDGKYPVGWTIQEHQVAYCSGRSTYWALGTYRLSVPVKNVKTTNPNKLEELVTERELWVVPWNWVDKYVPSRVTGEGKSGGWDNTFRYTKHADLPQVINTKKVPKGKVHLTTGVPNRFKF